MIELDYSLISDIDIDGVDTRDYPDFCDAHICSATYDGRPMTDEELDVLNEDYKFVHQIVWDKIF